MRLPTFLRFTITVLAVAGLVSSATDAAESGAVAQALTETAALTSTVPAPCPTCPEAVGLETLRQSIGGEIISVLVELRDAPGVMKKLAAERAGRAMSSEELKAHGATLLARQKTFLGSLSDRGVRALLRETDSRQIDGSVRHIEYQLTYLLNGFVAFAPRQDLTRLRSLPEVKHVFELHPARLLLDKAIDYSLGLQTNLAARRLAVYGPTQEFQPTGSTSHPEDPEANAADGVEGQGMIVAVIDSGADWRHPMFGGSGLTTPAPRVSGQPETTNDNRKIIYYYALSSPGDPTDDFGHGTLVTSCIAGYAVDGNTTPRTGYGTGQNGTGIGPTPNGVLLHGMAPQTRIMAYKVCGPANNCLGDIELAIEDAASPYTLVGSTISGTVSNTFISKPVADVINMSLGDTTGDPAGSTSVIANNAVLAGTIVVAAAGNTGPGPSTIGSPAAATLAISAAASYDPGSLSVGDLLASNQVPGETRLPGSSGPAPETGAVSASNTTLPGGRQTMRLFPVAGGGALPNGSLSAHYVFVDRRDNTSTVPMEVRNRIALAKGTGTFAQIANAIAPFQPAAIIIITAVDNATAVQVAGGIPTFTMGPSDGNYLIDRMVTGDPGDGDDSVDVPQGTISELPLRLAESATLDSFQPGMASFSSRGPNGHPNARYRVVKPDVSAPGVGILGAATPDGVPSETIGLANPSGYVMADGTSFACPITSGSMALIRQRVRALGLDTTNLAAAHYRSTRFDAATISRALLMNSASNLRGGLGAPQGDGTNSIASINDMGAGHINVDGALHASAIMVAPTLLLTGLAEFITPTNDPPAASDFDSEGNLKVFIPSASFGAVPIVGVNGTIVLTQEVVLRSITSGGDGTYNLSMQNNRNLDHPGFLVEIVSAQGSPITSATLQSGRASFFVRVTADGTLINVDPTECQWYVTAVHSVTGQTLRMPFYFRAVAPTILNIASPIQSPITADQPPQSGNTCATDTNSSYTLQWTYSAPAGGPGPVGFRVQEATRSTDIFVDTNSQPLVAGSNSIWAGGNDWSTQVDPNTTSLAYYVPDTANQNSSLTMVTSLPVPAGGATLSFATSQDFEDGFDKGYAEISTDGLSFTPVGSFGDNFFGIRVIDISQYAGQSLKVRFRIVSDLLNGPPDAAPRGWYIENIRITSDDFRAIASPAPSTSSLTVSGRANGTYYYRIAGVFSTPNGNAPGPYSETRCVTETIGTPVIVAIGVLTNHHTLLDCRGPAGAAHRIQATTNLSSWIDLGTNNAASNGTFQFEDSAAASFTKRFYRLVLP